MNLTSELDKPTVLLYCKEINNIQSKVYLLYFVVIRYPINDCTTIESLQPSISPKVTGYAVYKA